MVPHGQFPTRAVGVEPIRHHREKNVGYLVRVPERHLHLVGLGAFRLQASLDGLQAHIDADLPPVVAHQFHGDRLGRLEVQVLEGDGELGPVRVFPQPVAVHITQPEFLEELTSVVRVVADVRLGPAILVPPAGRVRGDLARYAAAEVDGLVHLVPVNGVGQCAHEAPLALAPDETPVFQVVVVVVRLQHDIADVETAPDVDLVDAPDLAQLQQRDVLGFQRERGEVQLAGGRLEGDHLGVLEQDDRVDGVDVRQLLPGRVDLEVVGIAVSGTPSDHSIPGPGGWS